MSVPYAIAAVLLITVPQIGAMAQAIYIFITYNLMLTVVYTLFQLPFATTMTYMTRDQNERAKINIIRMAMSPIGNILVTLLFTRILDMMPGGGMDSQKNWIILTAIYAVGAAALMLFCFATVRERVVVKDEMGGEQIPLEKRPCLLCLRINTSLCCSCSLYSLPCTRPLREPWLPITANGSWVIQRSSEM